MATGNTFKSDLYELFNYAQNSNVSYAKDIIVETLRSFFESDSYYHYQRDQWGFPKTPDLTDVPLTAGLNDDVTTRVFIGEPYRKDIIFYPAILVRHSGSRSVPISMSRDKGSVQYSVVKFVDGYGHEKYVHTPSYFVQSGAWEGQINIDIETRSPRSRDELADLIAIGFVDTHHDDLKDAGLLIKNVNIGSPSEQDDRNDKLYKLAITLDVRSEWARHIPIENTVDIIHICVDFGNLAVDPPVLAPNLTINTSLSLIEALIDS